MKEIQGELPRNKDMGAATLVMVTGLVDDKGFCHLRVRNDGVIGGTQPTPEAKRREEEVRWWGSLQLS